MEIRGIFRYLVETGDIDPLEPAPQQQALPDRLGRFRTWLERQRGISVASTHRHAFLIAVVLPALGDDPGVDDAARIRGVLSEHIERRSRSYARRLASALRMYLRFLVSEGCVAGTLAGAVRLCRSGDCRPCPATFRPRMWSARSSPEACAIERSSCCWRDWRCGPATSWPCA